LRIIKGERVEEDNKESLRYINLKQSEYKTIDKNPFTLSRERRLCFDFVFLIVNSSSEEQPAGGDLRVLGE